VKLPALLVISAGQLLTATFGSLGWKHFSRKAYVEPIVIRDGYHDFVLMGAPDYAEMQAAHEVLKDLSSEDRAEVLKYAQVLREHPERYDPIRYDIPTNRKYGSASDIHLILPALAEMAKVGRAKPYKMTCPDCHGGCPDCGRCSGTGKIATDCRCWEAGKIVCLPHDRC
jgi:hypothetical protein